ncbi:MAG: leucine-rich repeat domain-containing protein [Aureispira sp.]|nr:leucine-rich repeat domain-containing protein [Aureispira sp.]
MDKNAVLTKLEALINTGNKEDIELAFQLANSQEIYDIKILELWIDWLNKKEKRWWKRIILKELSQRVSLDLSDKGITFILKSLCVLKNLKHLNLRGNSFQQLPNSLAKLEKLESLNISNSHLRKLPSFIFELPNLRDLRIGSNEVLSLERIGELKGLQVLRLDDFLLKELPESIGDLGQLKTLLTDVTQKMD